MSGSEQPYEEARKRRKTERGQALETLRELIDESRKRARSHYTGAKERVKWVKLTGQLLWYRTRSFEASAMKRSRKNSQF